jgi:metal-responsive CopG/Arc/MetJ family transcriptional regulator
MTLTVRLEPQLEDQLEDYCQQEGTTKSAVVTEALRQYLNTLRQQRTPYELGVDLFGADESDSEDTDVSRNYKTLLKEKLRAKHSR